MKYIYGLAIAGILLAVFCACGKQKDTPETITETDPMTERVTEIVTETDTENTTAPAETSVAVETSVVTTTTKTVTVVTDIQQPDDSQYEVPSVETQPEPMIPVGDDVTFQISGNVLRVGDDASGFVAAMPPEFEETSPSIYGSGEDISYYYNDFTVYVWNGNGDAMTSGIDITGSGAATQKGITIGSSAQDVIDAYGAEYTEQAMDYVYTYGDCTLRFTLVDDQVHYISYHKNF